MRDELLYYYEQELGFLRRAGAEFAERYPKVASRLLLEPNKCADPHVERLLEAFAFLAARVHLKIDDDFSEISEALLNVVYPHYLRPLPSMSIVELRLDPEQGKLTTGLAVPRGAPLYSKPVGGAPCRFRTCYDTTLWPVTVAAAQWRAPDQLQPPVAGPTAVGALRVELQCLPDVSFEKLKLNTLRLHLNGESTLVSTLYELLCNNCVQIQIRDIGSKPPRNPIVLPGSALRPVGFAADEGMLPRRVVLMGGALAPVEHRGELRRIEHNVGADPEAAARLIGTTGNPPSSAMRNDPPLKRATVPSVLRVPSGKTMRECRWRTSRAMVRCCVASASTTRSVSRSSPMASAASRWSPRR